MAMVQLCPFLTAGGKFSQSRGSGLGLRHHFTQASVRGAKGAPRHYLEGECKLKPPWDPQCAFRWAAVVVRMWGLEPLHAAVGTWNGTTALRKSLAVSYKVTPTMWPSRSTPIKAGQGCLVSCFWKTGNNARSGDPRPLRRSETKSSGGSLSSGLSLAFH